MSDERPGYITCRECGRRGTSDDTIDLATAANAAPGAEHAFVCLDCFQRGMHVRDDDEEEAQ
jgi:hypothetical protein